MTLDQFYEKYKGKSVLYLPNPKREYLRGQCVQLASLYVVEVWGKPVIWADGAEWYTTGRLPEHYNRTKYNGINRPPRGSLIIWDSKLPNSGGAGHIAIAWNAPSGSGTFESFDSNWGGKTAKLVTHNWNHVIGWLTPVSVAQPKGDTEVKIGAGDNWRARFNRLHHQIVRNGDMSDAVFQSIVGQDAWKVVEGWSDHGEANRLIELQRIGEKAEKENWQGQLTSLTGTIKELQAKLAEANNKPSAVVIQEVEKIVEKCDIPGEPKTPQPPLWVKVFGWLMPKQK